MFEIIASETPNSFRSLLLAVDRLLSSEKAILNGIGHKGYLSASLKSTAFPDFTDQDMIFGHYIMIYFQDGCLSANLHFCGSFIAGE